LVLELLQGVQLAEPLLLQEAGQVVLLQGAVVLLQEEQQGE
jgi:hypothetical protein